MSIANSGYFSVLGWSNPLLLQLEQQALIPMFGEFPVELGLAGMELELLERFAEDDAYQEMFLLSFPEDETPISIENIVKAVSAFERTLYSGNSTYDQWLQEGVQCEDSSLMSNSECRGLELFFSENTECFHCHGGITFSDSFQSRELFFTEIGFHNTGLYNIDGEGAYPEDNQGLFDITGIDSDMGRFKAPTLRNIELTSPYMHDGSIMTLEEVMEHYVSGGRLIEEGDYAGDGRENPYKNDFIRGFEVTDEEFDDIISFLKSLTDTSFVTNPAFSDPFN
jgi:cytochrome c peroxidase